MEIEQLERIARGVLRELGAGEVQLTVAPVAGAHDDRWTVSVAGNMPATMTVRAGRGTTPQYIREQIFEQFQRR